MSFQVILQNKGDIHFCELLVAWESPKKFHLSMAMKKGHVDFYALNTMIKRMGESGMLEKVKKKHFLEIENCDESEVSSVGMEKLISIFVFLTIGGIFSFLLMAFEFIYTRFINSV